MAQAARILLRAGCVTPVTDAAFDDLVRTPGPVPVLTLEALSLWEDLSPFGRLLATQMVRDDHSWRIALEGGSLVD